MKWLEAAILLGILGTSTYGSDLSPQQIFDQRILPIFRSENPSSCVQCHLANVDLKEYILPTPEATFASLRAQGLIDVESPAKSKILSLIRMGERDSDEGARLIHATTRQAELDAFANWIEVCCRDPKLRNGVTPTELARPSKPDEVIRHAHKSRIVDSFVRNIWSQRMRCFPCHTPHEVDPENPKHEAAVKKQKEFAAQYDDPLLARLQIFRESPEATMRYLLESSKSPRADHLPLINLTDPARSLLVLKPTAKLPAKNPDGTFEPARYREPVSHLGGLKMHMHDQSYKSFVAWIQDYGRVVQGEYRSIDDLPHDNWYPSKLILRVKKVPEAWAVGSPVQLFVHEWEVAKQTWSDVPVAFTQGTVTPRRFVNGALFLLGGTDQERDRAWREKATLERGKRYLVKTYVDQQQRIGKDPTAMLTNADFHGEAEIPKPRWRDGFRFAEVIDGSQLVRP